MHVRVVNGGFGYKNTSHKFVFLIPVVISGARAFSVFGSTGKIVETYDDVDDVEEYDFDSETTIIDLTDTIRGKTYSLTDQIVVGEWDPTQILSLDRYWIMSKNLIVI